MPAAPRPNDPRLRVAYVLPDLRAAWDRLGPLFRAHDRRRFAIAGFAFNPDDGSPACREAREPFEQLAFLPQAGDRETAMAIAAWAPDILVDLGGYRPEARPGAIRHAPAGVKLLWLGMTGTTGAPWMQGIVADPVALPATLESAFSERVLRLPRCFHPAVAPTGLPRTGRAALGLPEEAVVLAAFQDPRTLDAESFQLWLRILRRSEKAVLWLTSPGQAQQQRLRRRAEQSGVTAQRLLFAPPLPWRAHLARLAQADLALDTLVFGAQSGVGDALGQGVPFLTVAGSTLQTRIATSLVTECGLPELAQPTPEAMEELAVTLIGDPARLAELKARLHAVLPGSRLFDVQGFAADLEQLYLGLAAPR